MSKQFVFGVDDAAFYLAVGRESVKIKRKGIFTMHRKFLISMVVILMLTTGAFADIGQIECFSIGSLNIVRRSGMVGSARGRNMVDISHSQQVHKPYYSVTARQKEEGVLVQRAATKGDGGASGLKQRATVQGEQGQKAKPYGSNAQDQVLNVKLKQVAMKKGGVGFTEGTQSFIGSQSQTITTPRVTSTEKQTVEVEQYSLVSGRSGSEGKVVNTVNVEMSQEQVVGK